MSGVPTFMHGDKVVLIRTENGYAVAPDKASAIEECVAFETWEAIAFYLAANFAPTPA